MRITFLTTSALALLTCLATSLHADCVKLGHATNDLLLCKKGSQIYAHSNGARLNVDKKLSNVISKSDDAFALDSDAHDEYAIYVRQLSMPKSGGEGYCGAGHEDSILLLDKHAGTIRLRSSVLVQSCLKNMSLSSDTGDNPRQAIKAGKFPIIATFDLITDDGRIITKKVVAHDGELTISDTQPPIDRTISK